jgi:hypothetical protein
LRSSIGANIKQQGVNMSAMCYTSAIRSPQSKSVHDLYLLAVVAYGCEPDDKEGDEQVKYFKYENGKHNISVYKVYNGTVCVDYILEDKYDAYEVDATVSLKKISQVKKWMKGAGFDISDICVKVVYYHNGGCAGLCEIK